MHKYSKDNLNVFILLFSVLVGDKREISHWLLSEEDEPCISRAIQGSSA